MSFTIFDNYNQTGHLFTFYMHFNYYFKYHDTVLYRDIFGSYMQYYFLVVSHIPKLKLDIYTCTCTSKYISWFYYWELHV